MRQSIVMLILFLATVSNTFAATPRQVAITIDDLPWVELAQSSEREVATRHQRLVRALRGTHAIGFVNEDKLYQSGALMPARRQMLQDWIGAGLDLGNHTYDHVDLHAVDLDTYEAAILKGEENLRALLATGAREPRWFRHPYLHAGRDDRKQDALGEFLTAHHYRIAPVTIDSGEWIWARAYVNTLNAGDKKTGGRLCRRYIEYMIAKFAFYEKNTEQLFGRPIAQVLLLHANALNADALPELMRRLQRRGYRFVSIEKALADNAYEHADTYRGPAGISWIHRWAISEKKPREFYLGEPTVPKDVLERAGVGEE